MQGVRGVGIRKALVGREQATEVNHALDQRSLVPLLKSHLPPRFSLKHGEKRDFKAPRRGTRRPGGNTESSPRNFFDT